LHYAKSFTEDAAVRGRGVGGEQERADGRSNFAAG